MENKTQARKTSVVSHCVSLSCLIFSVVLTIYVLLELQTLRNQYEELQRYVADNLLQMQTFTKTKGLKNNIRTENTFMRQARQLTSHNLIADLLHAQAQILETHCTNDSKLCMQGPKGETGPKGDPGIPGKAMNPECSCLSAPSIRGDASQHYLVGGRPAVLHCLTIGKPDPFVTWAKDGVRISGITNQNLTVTVPGNYTCTAENIVGVATLTYHVT